MTNLGTAGHHSKAPVKARPWSSAWSVFVESHVDQGWETPKQWSSDLSWISRIPNSKHLSREMKMCKWELSAMKSPGDVHLLSPPAQRGRGQGRWGWGGLHQSCCLGTLRPDGNWIYDSRILGFQDLPSGQPNTKKFCTVDGQNPAPVHSLSHALEDFNHPRWCSISAINSQLYMYYTRMCTYLYT